MMPLFFLGAGLFLMLALSITLATRQDRQRVAQPTAASFLIGACEVQLHWGGTGTDIGNIVVTAPTLAAVEFELRRETRFDRLAKRLRLANEGQVGIPGFDRAVYLTGDDAHVLTGLRFDPELAFALERLLEPAMYGPEARCVTRVDCRGGRVLLEVRVVADIKRATSIATDAALRLQPVALRLDAAAGSMRPDPGAAPARVLVAIGDGLAAYGLLVAFTVPGVPVVLANPALFQPVAIGAGVAFALLASAVVLTLGRSSHAHRVLPRVLLGGGFGIVASACAWCVAVLSL